MATNEELTDKLSMKTYNNVDRNEQLMYVEVAQNKFAGYRRELLVNSLSELETDFYVCTECEGVMRNACQVGEEQNLVCEGCVKKGVRSSSLVKSRKKISELQANCPIAVRDCDWNGTLAEVEIHLIVCEKVVVKCKNGCDVIFPRSELDFHLKHSCVKREMECEHCTKSIVYEKLIDHYEECLEYLVRCPNNCNVDLKRKLIDSHLVLECPNMVVECPYKKFGCEEELPKCELEEHKITNRIQHLESMSLFAVTEMEQLKQTNKQLTETNKQLNKTNTRLTETNTQLTETNTQLTETNKDQTERNNHLTKCNTKQTNTNNQLAETNNQLTETNNQLTKTNNQLTQGFNRLAITNMQLTERLDTLNNQVTSLTHTVELSSYPIILRDEVFQTIPYRVYRKLKTCEVIWKFLQISVMFQYTITHKSISVSISMKYVEAKIPLAKLPFQGRFKLTMIDNFNMENSLVYESGFVKLQPHKVSQEYKHPCSFFLTHVPMKYLHEGRFQTEGNVIFTLQVQETAGQ